MGSGSTGQREPDSEFEVRRQDPPEIGDGGHREPPKPAPNPKTQVRKIGRPWPGNFCAKRAS